MDEPRLNRELTTGQIVPMRRIDFRVWATFGRIPDYLLKTMIGAQAGERPASEEAEQTPEEAAENLRFVREVFVESVRPMKVVPGGTAKDEIDPMRLDFDKDIIGTFQWQVAGAPGVAVATKDGKGTSVDALNTFRQKRTGKKSASPRARKPRLRRKV